MRPKEDNDRRKVKRKNTYIMIDAIASRSINIFNDNAVCHFRNILKLRQKQITLDNVLVRQRPSGSDAESSGAVRKEKERELPSK
jgi:hypothetical protein